MADKLNQLTNPNQSDRQSLFTALQSMMDRGKLTTDGMIPAQVISYDRDKNLATIKPIISFVGLDGKQVDNSRQELVEIPVLALGGGGFVINFPLNSGDLGWIFAGDRELSTFLEELKPVAPAHGRAKSFADGLYIPDIFRQYTLNAEDQGAMVIQSVDGATRISIRKDNIKITAPSGVLIDSTLRVTQLATFDGGIKTPEGVPVDLAAGTTVGGINVSTHGHTQQNNGSGRTSGGMTS